MPRPKKNLKSKPIKSMAKTQPKNDNEVTDSCIGMPSAASVGCDVESKSFWQRYRSVIFETMKMIQIFVCLTYCTFFLMAIISKKEWLKVYHDHIRFQVFGLSIHWYESAIYFLISGMGLIAAVGEVLCLSIFYSFAHTIAIPYCVVPWFVTVGIYRGWGWTQMYTQVCTNFKKLLYNQN